MLKTILLVLDGQDIDHPSLTLAQQWAKRFDAMLVVLGIVDHVGIIPLEPVPLGAATAKRIRDEARVERHRATVESSLSEIARCCAESQVAFKPLETEGWTYEQIQLEAQRFDLIVMAPRSTEVGATVDLTINAPLVGLLHATPRPVVFVPDHAEMGESILVAYDGSLQSARALRAFLTTGLTRLGQLHVVSVHADPHEAARCGDRAVDFLSYHKIPAQLHAIAQTGAQAEHLMDMANRLGTGLVVMGAYGKSQVREFFLGSVTQSMLKNCKVPLFLYH